MFNICGRSALDVLREKAMKKKKEKKKCTRKRVRNVEALIKGNTYDIFEFINPEGGQSGSKDSRGEPGVYDVRDRAKLHDDYKMVLEGYSSRKKMCKVCEKCRIDKTLMHSEGIYVCMKCGEVENYIIENEVS